MHTVQINATCGTGSTGKICVGISRALTAAHIDNTVFYAAGADCPDFGEKYMTRRETKIQALKSRAFGNYGFNSAAATKRLLLMLQKADPDTVILHNLHGHNCHLGMLLSYLKRERKKVVWVFHDCWAFTGYCPHYDMIGCEKWKDTCGHCPLKREFSWLFDKSADLLERKKELLSDLNLTVVTPSEWMKRQAEQSFLAGYPIQCIHNGIDLSVFRPTESDFRARHRIGNKPILLGVAFGWGRRKGLDVFERLAHEPDAPYQLVLVGTDERVDKSLPENVISVHRTQDARELAEIYTAADLLVNPTREENYPTVNMESLACGTPVLTFDTGGSAEMLTPETGIAVKRDDYDALREVIFTAAYQRLRSEACVSRARDFDEQSAFRQYAGLVSRLTR